MRMPDRSTLAASVMEEFTAFSEALGSWLDSWVNEADKPKALARHVATLGTPERRQVQFLMESIEKINHSLIKARATSLLEFSNMVSDRDSRGVLDALLPQAKEGARTSNQSPTLLNGTMSSVPSASATTDATVPLDGPEPWGGPVTPGMSTRTPNASVVAEMQEEVNRKRMAAAERVSMGEAVESLMDVYLLSLTMNVIQRILAEMLASPEAIAQARSGTSTLASHFIASALPQIEKLLRFEPSLFQENLFAKTTRGLSKGTNNIVWRGMVYRARVLDSLFVSHDIYVLPKAISVATREVKSISLSHIVPWVAVTGGYDKIIRLTDSQSKRTLGQFVGHKSIVTAAVLTPDDTLLVSGACDHTVKVWASQTGQHLRTLSGHEDSVLSVDVSPDGTLIASAGMDKTVRLWKTETGDPVRLLKGHRSWVKTVKFTPDGQSVISGGIDRRVIVWSINSTKSKFTLDAHTGYVLDLDVVAPNLLITTSRDRSVKIWDYNTGHLLRSHTGHPSWPSVVKWSPGGAMFACASFDNLVLIYDTISGELLRQILVHNDGILSLAWAADGLSLMVGTVGGKLQILPL